MATQTEQEKLRFDADSHTYWLGSQEILSVTTALKIAGEVDDVWFTEFGRQRGIAVHTAIQYLLDDDLIFESLDARLKPYVEAAVDFLRWSKFKPFKALCEVPNYHPDFMYAGTPDLVGFMNGSVVVIEIKSGDIGHARKQVAAYSEFPNIRKLNARRFSLKVQANGTCRLTEYVGIGDFIEFLNDLNKAKQLKKGEVWMQ